MRAEQVDIKLDKEAASERATECSRMGMGAEPMSDRLGVTERGHHTSPRTSPWYTARVMELLR